MCPKNQRFTIYPLRSLAITMANDIQRLPWYPILACQSHSSRVVTSMFRMCVSFLCRSKATINPCFGKSWNDWSRPWRETKDLKSTWTMFQILKNGSEKNHSNKMVGWEQISRLFIDSDHNNLQFWILNPPVNLPARYSWCGMGTQTRHSSCLWFFAKSIEIQKSIWKSHWNHYMMLDAKNCPIFPPFSIFGPRLVPQMAIFPMAFGAFSPTI